MAGIEGSVTKNAESTNTSESSGNRVETRRTISPYDLTAADNPGAIISYPLLTGTNYDEWSCSFKTALRSRKKFGFLDGTIPQPNSDSPDYEDWIPINALLVSWIKMTIHDSIRSSISHREIARDLWEHLQKRFSVSTGPKHQLLKSELANCRQNGSSVESYYGRLNKIWDQIAVIRPLRVCRCTRCICNNNDAIERDREEDKVQDFVYGLDDRFQAIRSNLVSRIPLPLIEEVYNAVRQEEDMQSKSLLRDSGTDIMALAAKIKPKFKDDREKTVMCIHCKRSGHVSEKCFAVVGYPDWWGTRSRPRLNNTRDQNTSKHITASANAALQQISPGQQSDISSQEQLLSLLRQLNTGNTNETAKLSGMPSPLNWILDTGASHHMTGQQHLLSNLRNIAPNVVILADGTERVATQEGTVRLGPNLVLKSVFFVPQLQTDLISVGQMLDENKCVVLLTAPFMLIQDLTTKMVIGLGKRMQGTFYFQGIEQANAVTTLGKDNFELWHSRFGHPSEKVLAGVSDISLPPILNKACDTCLRAKQCRDSFPLSNNISDEIFDLVHADVWGPYRTPSSTGARFFLTLVDDKSRNVWIYLMREKSETQSHIQNFISLIQRQFGRLLKKFRSDNGTEFMCLASYFRTQGIIHETSCVGTPNQNGRAERKHRHILNIARALRFHASLPIMFWGECILTAGYLINRTPSSVLHGKTPFEILYHKVPSSRHLRVFGSLCYAHNQNTNGDKFVSRSRKCVFIGYPNGQKGWRLYDLESHTFFVSRDVKFFEEEFPYASSSSATPSTSPAEIMAPVVISLAADESFQHLQDGTISLHIDSPSPSPESVQSPISSSSLDSVAEAANTVFPSAVLPPDFPAPNEVSHAPALRRSTRERQPSTRLQGYVTEHVNLAATSSPTPQESDSCSYPISNFVSSHRFSENHRAFQAAISSAYEPSCYNQAVRDADWRNAMSSEISAQEVNKTWTVTDLPLGKKAIGCKWVFKLKYRSDGSLERHKARLVALGNKQKAGEDFGETFAPVAKMGTVRVFLKFAAGYGWPVHQMDVHNAFLHGDLQEEVYMKLPPGFQASDSNKVCKLNKSLYGLKQAPRCWFAKLSTALLAYGFRQSTADYSLFIFNQANTVIRILVYVDDLIITGSSEDAVLDFKTYLSSTFHMKDLGLLKYFLGLEIAHNEKGFYLCQRKYALDIIMECGLLGSKPSPVPLPQHHKLSLSDSPVLSDPTPYRRLIGKLIYLANTRPDLAYAVHTLAQYMQQPRDDHWEAALKVVRYLKNSPGQGILLSSNTDFGLNGWCDSDWGSCPTTRRSLSGYVVLLGDSPISWKTKKQPKVSLSSAEAEYRSMVLLTKELIWLKSLLEDFTYSHKEPMMIFSDSKSAIALAANPVFHERTKHVGMDCHFIRDEIATGTIQTVFVPTTSQLADILTKALGSTDLAAHNGKLGIVNLHAPA